MTPLTTPQRQHPLGILILAVRFVTKAVQQFWPAIVGLTVTNLDASLLIAIPLALSLMLGYATLYFLRFKFYTEEGAMIVRRGVIRKERLQIPVERIQALNLYQGPIQQAFGLTGLRVDTAGSAGNEVNLVAIRRADAEALRHWLSEADRLTEKESPHDAEEASDMHQADPHRGKEWIRLRTQDLFRVGIAQNHFRNGLFGLAVLASLTGGIESQIESWLTHIPPVVMGLLAAASFLLIIPGLVLMWMCGVLVSLVLTVIGQWKFTSEMGTEGVYLEGGLLKRNSVQIPFKKVHLTVWRSHWMQRALGFETVQIRQAQAGEHQTGVKAFIPAVLPEHREVLEKVLYPDLEGSTPWTLKPVRRLRWLIWLAAAAPAGLLFLSWSPQVAGWSCAVWVAFTGWTSWRRFQSMTMEVHMDTVVIEKGWFWRKRMLLKLSQLQGAEWKRHLFLERRGVGHLTFHTAAGGMEFRYLRREEGLRLLDFALNQAHLAQISNANNSFAA